MGIYFFPLYDCCRLRWLRSSFNWMLSESGVPGGAGDRRTRTMLLNLKIWGWEREVQNVQVNSVHLRKCTYSHVLTSIWNYAYSSHDTHTHTVPHSFQGELNLQIFSLSLIHHSRFRSCSHSICSQCCWWRLVLAETRFYPGPAHC